MGYAEICVTFCFSKADDTLLIFSPVPDNTYLRTDVSSLTSKAAIQFAVLATQSAHGKRRDTLKFIGLMLYSVACSELIRLSKSQSVSSA